MKRLDSDIIFALAILKGFIEHWDGTAYFGSLMGYQSHHRTAVARGWVSGTSATEAGSEVYKRCHLAELPTKKHSRAYAWCWTERYDPDEAPKDR